MNNLPYRLFSNTSNTSNINRVEQMETIQKEGLELFKKKTKIMVMHLQVMEL